MRNEYTTHYDYLFSIKNVIWFRFVCRLCLSVSTKSPQLVKSNYSYWKFENVEST